MAIESEQDSRAALTAGRAWSAPLLRAEGAISVAGSADLCGCFVPTAELVPPIILGELHYLRLYVAGVME